MNKKILIILSIVLLVTIAFLAIYAYQLSQENNYTNPTPPPIIKDSISKPVNNSTEDINKLKADLENIQVDNQTFKVQEDCDYSEEETEKVEEYAKEVTSGELKIAKGAINSISGSSLKMTFTQDSFTWQSTVTVNQNTSITDFATSSNLSLSELKTGDFLVVRTASGGVTDTEFTASSIFRE